MIFHVLVETVHNFRSSMCPDQKCKTKKEKTFIPFGAEPIPLKKITIIYYWPKLYRTSSHVNCFPFSPQTFPTIPVIHFGFDIQFGLLKIIANILLNKRNH